MPLVASLGAKMRTWRDATHADVKPGQVWVAADGGTYGHFVLNIVGSDAITIPFTKSGGFDGSTSSIDTFKITYRYQLPVIVPGWVPEFYRKATK